MRILTNILATGMVLAFWAAGPATAAARNPTMTAIALHTIPWKITWDTQERDLAPDAGEGSRAEISLDDSGLHLAGELGYFRASAGFGKPLVAFVRTTAVWTPPVPAIDRICIEASGRPAGLTLRLALETAYTGDQDRRTGKKGSYQADFTLGRERQEFCFGDADFDFVIRGVRQAAPPIRLGEIRSLGLLVTRSSQAGSVATDKSRTPFRFTIHGISARYD